MQGVREHRLSMSRRSASNECLDGFEDPCLSPQSARNGRFNDMVDIADRPTVLWLEACHLQFYPTSSNRSISLSESPPRLPSTDLSPVEEFAGIALVERKS